MRSGGRGLKERKTPVIKVDSMARIVHLHWPEVLIVGAGFLILIAYHICLLICIKLRPQATALGKANELRRRWVNTVMVEKRDILGVQTLRNWVMSSTFLAGTSILISSAILNVTFQTDRIAQISQDLNFMGSRSVHLWMIKLLTLTVTLFFAFFNFTLSIRYYNHAGFMIDIPITGEENGDVAEATAVVNRGAVHYFLGMRGYYLAVPLTLWLFGPIWMLGGAILLTGVLFHLDHTV